VGIKDITYRSLTNEETHQIRVMDQGGVELTGHLTGLQGEVDNDNLVKQVSEALDIVKVDGISFPFAEWENLWQIASDFASTYSTAIVDEFKWSWIVVENISDLDICIMSPSKKHIISIDLFYDYILTKDLAMKKAELFYEKIKNNKLAEDIYSSRDFFKIIV